MRNVCSIFSQLLQLFPRGEFERLVRETQAERHARGFTCWGQFVAMLFCQLGRAHSLREICGGLATCEGKINQVQTNVRATHVRVEERLDGSMRITHHGRALAYHVIAARPVKTAAGSTVHHPRRPVPPRPDHPWRKRWRPEREQHTAGAII